jgi:uncharacterized protein YndB with AHSA1/START domain
MSDTDRIERDILLKAKPSRVWRALSDPGEFGTWFGCDLAGQVFEPGRHVRGPFTIPGHTDASFDAIIDRVEPERLLSYRWHPHAVDPKVDYSGETRTLVTLTVEPVGDGCRVRVVESGFDAVPAERRKVAFPANTGGWEWQLKNIARHVAG